MGYKIVLFKESEKYLYKNKLEHIKQKLRLENIEFWLIKFS